MTGNLNRGRETKAQREAGVIQPGKARSTIDCVRQIAKLDNRKKEIEDELKSIAERRALLEPQVLAYFEQHGIGNTRIEGRIVGMRVDVRASVVAGTDEDTLKDAFDAAGVGNLVKRGINAQTLSSYVREQRVAERPLSNAITTIINVHDIPTVFTRREPAKPKKGQKVDDAAALADDKAAVQ